MTPKKIQLGGLDGIGATFAIGAINAITAYPKVIKQLGQLADPAWITGCDPQFKIAALRFFYAQSGAGEIGRTQVGESTIDDGHLPM